MGDNSGAGVEVIREKSLGEIDAINPDISVGLTDHTFSTIPATISMKKLNMNSIQITPKTLNRRCENAARLAEILADMAARLAVIVVPIFSPIIMAAADSKPIHPLEHIIRVMATVALDD